jgi:hypothetical protein
MNEIFVTIVGFKNYYDEAPIAVGDIVKLVKDPDNEHDHEAICVKKPRFDIIGYVANSTSTVAQGTYSAGRLYDKFDKTCRAEIEFILSSGAIARVIRKN